MMSCLSLREQLKETLTHQKIRNIINKILNIPDHDGLRFGKVETTFDWQAVMAFRLKMYDQTVKYMLNELNAQGSDAYDSHSLIFAVWKNDSVIATIRLTHKPFETMQFLSAQQLNKFLGEKWGNYLEWTRLLIDSSCKIPKLLPALTVYAGLTILATTNYNYYFGYTRPLIRKILSRFQIAEDSMQFSVPNRGEHSYYLLKGNFLNDYNHLVKTGITK